MSLIDLLVLLLIAGICGALGQAISGYSRGGCLVSIALGFIGALLGGWLARQLAAAPFEVQVLEPEALRAELRTVGERLLRAAAVR